MTTPVTAAASAAAGAKKANAARARPRTEDLEELAQAAAALGGARPTGGPLALHEPVAIKPTLRVDELAERMIVGKTREGHPEVRLQLAAGAFWGTEVRLVAGKHGLEATLVVATEAARRVVEAQLADLARALESRGLRVARCRIATPGQHGRDRQDP